MDETCPNLIWNEDSESEMVCGTPLIFKNRFCPVCNYDQEEQTRIQSVYEIADKIRGGAPVEEAIAEAYHNYPEWREHRPVERMRGEKYSLGRLERTSLEEMTGQLLGWKEKNKTPLTWKDKKILETEDSQLRRLLKHRKRHLEGKRKVSWWDEEEEIPEGYQVFPQDQRKKLLYQYNLWMLISDFCKPYFSGDAQVGSNQLETAIQQQEKANQLGYHTIIIPNPIRDRNFVIWEILPKLVIPYVYNHKGSLIHLGHSTEEVANKMIRSILKDQAELLSDETRILQRKFIVAPASQRFVEGFDTDQYLPNWNPNWKLE